MNLQAAGRIEEVTKFLFKKQIKAIEKALERNKKQGEIIRAKLAENKRLEQQRQNLKALQPKRTNKVSNGFSTTAMSTTSTLSSDTYFVSEQNNKKDDGLILVKKEKKKTRGEAYKGMTPPQPMIERLEEPVQPFISITQLTSNKNAWKTFNKLFSLHQRGNTFDNEVQISLYEIKDFFKALKQDYDPSKGKGGHKKATLNFQAYGSEMDEKMITLTQDLSERISN